MTDRQPYEEEIDLVEYIKVVYKYRWMVTILVFLAMLVTAILGLRQPSKFEASATFFPLYASTLPAAESVMVRPGPDIKDLIISILESRKMADRIIDQLGLQKKWDITMLADARKVLNKTVQISLEKNGLIRLSVMTQDREQSARIANAYVDNLEYFNQELNIGPQKQIVQVIDRAVVPEHHMSRGTVRRTITGGVVCFVFSILLAYGLEFIKRSNMISRLKS